MRPKRNNSTLFRVHNRRHFLQTEPAFRHVKKGIMAAVFEGMKAGCVTLDEELEPHIL